MSHLSLCASFPPTKNRWSLALSPSVCGPPVEVVLCRWGVPFPRAGLSITAQGDSQGNNVSLCFCASSACGPLQTPFITVGVNFLTHRTLPLLKNLQWLPVTFRIKASAGEPTETQWKLTLGSNDAPQVIPAHSVSLHSVLWGARQRAGNKKRSRVRLGPWV